MSQKFRTQDESYVIQLYRSAIELGDVHSELHRYEVGNKINLHPKKVNTICKLLLQANFIKKTSETHIILTKHGEQLALKLLAE